MKKVLLILTAIIICFTLTGCDMPVEGNKEFGEYTGIYKKGNVMLKVAHYKNTLLVIMNKDNEPYANTTINLEGNKFEDFDCKFEFNKNVVAVTTDKKDIPSGNYIRVKPYTTEEIYKEYVGDIKYVNSKYNGIYKNDKYSIYTVQTTKDTLRFANYNEEMSTNLDTAKIGDNSFASDFFDDYYELKFNGKTLEASFKSDDSIRNLTGNYTRKSKMKAVEVIKTFAFDDYREE